MDDFTKRLRDDLEEAAKTLRRYEALHIAKGTPESMEKAAVNAGLAARFEASLAETACEADMALQALEELHQLGYAIRDGLLYPPVRSQPAGDAGMPVVAQQVDEHRFITPWHPNFARGTGDLLVRQCDALAAIAARDALVAGLEADLRARDERIASMRTEHGQEVSDLLVRIATLEAEGAKSERRAIEFGDILHRHVLVMRAAVVEQHHQGADEAMIWIVNTLAGPGHLPSGEEIALGAQALFEKEVAEHEAFRAAHPGPAAPQPKESS